MPSSSNQVLMTVLLRLIERVAGGKCLPALCCHVQVFHVIAEKPLGRTTSATILLIPAIENLISKVWETCVQHLHGFPSHLRDRLRRKAWSCRQGAAETPDHTAGGCCRMPAASGARELVRFSSLCAEKDESAPRKGPEKLALGLHRHLTADNVVYVNHKLWSRNANGIRRRN